VSTVSNPREFPDVNKTIRSEPAEVDGRAWSLSSRTAAAGILLLAGAGVFSSSFMNPGAAGGAALAVVAATLAIGVLPGAALTLFWRPHPGLTLLEIVGFGIALSFGLVQLLTILAISAHVSPIVTLSILFVATTGSAVAVLLRSVDRVRISLDDAIVLIVIAAAAATLYIVGAPVDSAEDQIHAAIARRLSALGSPGFDNVYVTPGIVYTYPFPGTHYFLGMISRLGGIDALFLYHKVRFFWAAAAFLMIYLSARAVFGSRGVATAVAITSVVLVWTGVFSLGFPTGWGQLVPYSHASDIAMSVLLPCLLAATFSYLRAALPRERWFLFTVTALLILMLTMVHMREIVQFAAYLGCFAVVAAVFRDIRPYLARTAGLLALTIGMAAVYSLWQGQMVPLVDNIVDTNRAELLNLASSTSAGDLLLRPVSGVFPDLLQKFDQIFLTLLPLFLFAGPVVIVVFRRQPLVWLLAAVIVAYLLVMSVPILAVPYIYFTYFEILHLPVRNIIFFVYLLAGALLYVAALALAQVDRTKLSLPVAGACAGALALLAVLTLNQTHGGFFVPLIAAYLLTFFYTTVGRPRSWQLRSAVAGVVAIGALIALWPDRAPVPRSEHVTVRWAPELPDADRGALEARFSLGQPESKPEEEAVNVWNYRLSNLSRDNVRDIVEHPAVADTHFIDRETFEVESQPPKRDHLPWGVRYVRWLQYPGILWFALAGIFAWALAFVAPPLIGRYAYGDAAGMQGALQAPFHAHVAPFALFMIPFVLWSVYPTVSPLNPAAAQPAGRWSTPRQLIAELPCVTMQRMEARFTEHLFEDDPVMLEERTNCPPPYEVVEWMQRNLPPEGVLAIDRWNSYPSVMFSPQQAVVFPTLEASFVREDTLFDEYYAEFYARMRKYRAQPFFNTVETLEERRAYIGALGVTHVLVNPAHYDALRPVLDSLPNHFSLKHARDRWAIYEVIRS
jgi:hypothetical protein